jgi:hypothetical protein
MRSRSLAAVALTASIALAACGGSDGDDGGGGPPATTGDAATFTRVRNEVLTPRCTGCHFPANAAAAGGLDLTGSSADVYARLVGVPSPTAGRSPATRVAPGNPAGSLLHRKLLITNTLTNPDPALGAGMPADAPGSLPQERKDLVRDWIQRGAPND